jgi:hypothetical protein
MILIGLLYIVFVSISFSTKFSVVGCEGACRYSWIFMNMTEIECYWHGLLIIEYCHSLCSIHDAHNHLHSQPCLVFVCYCFDLLWWLFIAWWMFNFCRLNEELHYDLPWSSPSQPFGAHGTLGIFIFCSALELEQRTKIYNKSTPIFRSLIWLWSCLC